MNKLRALTMLGIMAIIVPTAYGFDLPDGFDEPCPSGMSILQEVCIAINDLHDELHIQTLRIDSLNATKISEQAEQDGIQDDVTELQNDVSVLESSVSNINGQLQILEESLLIDEVIDLEVQATNTGAINPQSKGIYFYGSILCEIEQSGNLLIVFAANTTVQHLNMSCSPSNGNPINLNTNQTELFQMGDTLALERLPTEWVEVHRTQT